jgi:tetratricopeptide (TPR) repeat protein
MHLPLLLIALLAPFALIAQNESLDHLKQARDAYAAGDLDLAHAHADSALAMDPKVPGGLKLRGDIRQKQGNNHGALIDYTKAEKLEPDNARLFVSRAALHVTEGRLKEAVKDCDKAIKLAPNDPDPFYNRACANYLGQNLEGALRDLERSLQLRPTNADALFLRGVVKGEMYREEEGLADIEASLKLNPDQDGGDMSAGVLLFEMKRYEEAIARFDKVIARDSLDVAEAWYYKADSYYNLGNKDDACLAFRRSAERGDKDAQFIVRNYCNTDASKIPKKPSKKRKLVIEF